MNLTRFRENLMSCFLSSDGDGQYSSLRILTGGMSGIRTVKLLNLACRCLDEGEYYVEIGTFSGFSLLGAGYRHNSLVIGIDDFSMKDIVRPETIKESRDIIKKQLENNITIYGRGNLKFLEGNFRNVQFDKHMHGKMGVLFIDGDHDYKNVDDALAWAEPYLMPNAIVVFDDVYLEGVKKRALETLKEGWDILLFCIDTMPAHDKDRHMGLPLNELIGNGICVLQRGSAISPL